MNFPIDTGSDISLIPVNKRFSNARTSDLTLFAANDARVLIFGEKHLTINFGLRRNFVRNFCVAVVLNEIIRVDLLTHYPLVTFLYQSSSINMSVGLKTFGFSRNANLFELSIIDCSLIFLQILLEFPGITRMPQNASSPVCNVKHEIVT